MPVPTKTRSVHLPRWRGSCSRETLLSGSGLGLCARAWLPVTAKTGPSNRSDSPGPLQAMPGSARAQRPRPHSSTGDTQLTGASECCVRPQHRVERSLHLELKSYRGGAPIAPSPSASARARFARARRDRCRRRRSYGGSRDSHEWPSRSRDCVPGVDVGAAELCRGAEWALAVPVRTAGQDQPRRTRCPNREADHDECYDDRGSRDDRHRPR